MSKEKAKWGHKLAQWSVGLLLFPVGLFTFVLFLTTGRPIPCRFIESHELEFRLDRSGGFAGKDSRPILEAFSVQGNCFITAAPSLHVADNEPNTIHEMKLTVTDTATLRKLGSFPSTRFARAMFWLGQFDVDPAREYLMGSFGSSLEMIHLKSGAEKHGSFDTPWGFMNPGLNGSGTISAPVFAPGGRDLIIHSETRAIEYEYSKRWTINAFRVAGDRKIMGCYFDANGHSKALVLSSKLEVWNLASNQMERTLGDFELDNWGILANQYAGQWALASRPALLATACKDLNSVQLRSLEDGRLMEAFTIPGAKIYSLQFGCNDRFLICHYFRQHPFFRIASRINAALKDKFSRWFPIQWYIAVVDLRRNEITMDLAGHSQNRCAFSEDGARLVSFTEDGLFEYDIPPRWQYFTHWSWVALAASASLAIAWWRLRKRQFSRGLVG